MVTFSSTCDTPRHPVGRWEQQPGGSPPCVSLTKQPVGKARLLLGKRIEGHTSPVGVTNDVLQVLGEITVGLQGGEVVVETVEPPANPVDGLIPICVAHVRDRHDEPQLLTVCGCIVVVRGTTPRKTYGTTFRQYERWNGRKTGWA